MESKENSPHQEETHMLSKRSFFLIVVMEISAIYLSLVFYPSLSLFLVALTIGSLPLLSAYSGSHPHEMTIAQLASALLVGAVWTDYLGDGRWEVLVDARMLAFYLIVLTLHFFAVRQMVKLHGDSDATIRTLLRYFFIYEGKILIFVSLFVAAVTVTVSVVGRQSFGYVVLVLGGLVILAALAAAARSALQQPINKSEGGK